MKLSLFESIRDRMENVLNQKYRPIEINIWRMVLFSRWEVAINICFIWVSNSCNTDNQTVFESHWMPLNAIECHWKAMNGIQSQLRTDCESKSCFDSMAFTSFETRKTDPKVKLYLILIHNCSIETNLTSISLANSLRLEFHLYNRRDSLSQKISKRLDDESRWKFLIMYWI